MANDAETDLPGKTALISSADFIKFSVAIGTGALLFSVGLIPDTLPANGYVKWVLVLSWIALSVSVTFGLMVFSRIPVKLKTKNYELDDMWFVIPGLIHQFSLVLGIVLIGTTLVLTIIYLPARGDACAALSPEVCACIRERANKQIQPTQ